MSDDRGMDDIETPALLVELDVLESNTEAMAQSVRSAGKSLLPNIKSHKTVEIAGMQLRAGAAGLTCQKLGEAEVMLATDCADFLITTPIVGARKLDRLMDLAGRTHMTVAVDSVEAAGPMSAAASERGLVIDVLIEVDVGFHRCGLQPSEVIELASRLERLDGIHLSAIMTFEGHVYDQTNREDVAQVARVAFDGLARTAEQLRAAGFEISRVSVGATAAAQIAVTHPIVTEIRAGSYALGDLAQVQMGAMALDACALGVLATVVSVPGPDRVVLDAGSKSLSFATVPGRDGFGHIDEHPDAVIERLSDEHAIVRRGSRDSWAVGDRVRIVPNSHTNVVNTFDEMTFVRRGHRTGSAIIVARGRSQ